MNVLLLNAGSSSLKCTLASAVDGAADPTGAAGEILARASADWAQSPTRYVYAGPDGREHEESVDWNGHAQATRRFIDDLLGRAPMALRDRADLAAVGHRIVHGGPFTSSVRITPALRAQIAALSELAPLHNPPSLETLAAAEAVVPDVPHVATFDTAFHATLPAAACVYPVPRKWTREWGIRRYGFHGLSHSYCARRAAEMLGRRLESSRLVICHLGHGCSACAVRGGVSVDTTMGFTPLEGLMMGTRSGSVDPGAILHVQERHGLSATEVDAALNHESGLLGVSGRSADMRQVLAAARDGNEDATLAIEVYVHRVRQAIGALAVTMGGVDALVFTAGVGEHSSEIRRLVCSGLACLGLELDARLNESTRPDADVATRESAGRIFVIATREDVTMLHEVVSTLASKRLERARHGGRGD